MPFDPTSITALIGVPVAFFGIWKIFIENKRAHQVNARERAQAAQNFFAKQWPVETHPLHLQAAFGAIWERFTATPEEIRNLLDLRCDWRDVENYLQVRSWIWRSRAFRPSWWVLTDARARTLQILLLSGYGLSALASAFVLLYLVPAELRKTASPATWANIALGSTLAVAFIGLAILCVVGGQHVGTAREFVKKLPGKSGPSIQVSPTTTSPTDTTTLHRATPADLDALAALFDAYRQFYEQPANLSQSRAFIEQRLARGDSWLWLARQGERAVGFCQCYPIFSSTAPVPGPAVLLNDLYVLPEARGLGVAQALMQAAETHARAQGCVYMELSTARSNTSAQALYARAGWVRDEVFFIYGKVL